MSDGLAHAGVRTFRRGPVQVMTIERPEVRNAIDRAASRALADAIEELEATPELRVGVLTGAGGVFSAGMDLKAFGAGDSPDLPGIGMGGITTRPPRKPLVAAVEGWALAGGFEMVLACDMIVAAPTARFGLPEVKRGLVAGGGGVIRLAQRLPRAMAMEMLLTGDPIDGKRAHEVGLVNRVVNEGEALAAALDLAERVAANAPLPIDASKEIVRLGAGRGEEEAFALQAPLVESVLASEDAVEGARAFVEKRQPRWRGV